MIGRIAALLGVTLTASAILGIVLQVISYVAAASYFRAFGIEPADAGITPFNAAFRLNGTYLALLRELVRPTSWSLIVLVFLVGLLYSSRSDVRAMNRKRSATALEKEAARKKEENLVRESIKFLNREQLAQVRSQIAESREEIRLLDERTAWQQPSTFSLKRIFDSALFSILIGALTFYALVHWAGLGRTAPERIGLQAAACVINGCSRFADPENSPSAEERVDGAFRADVKPQEVNVDWTDPTKIPKFAFSRPLLPNGLPVSLIATVGDRYYIYLRTERRVLVLRTSDVNLYFYPPDCCPRGPNQGR